MTMRWTWWCAAAACCVGTAGAGRLVDGYATTRSAPWRIEYESYRGTKTPAAFLYLNLRKTGLWRQFPRKDHPYAIEWDTAPAPEDLAEGQRVTFCWGATMSGARNEHVLGRDPRPLLWDLWRVTPDGVDRLVTFACGIESSMAWTNGDAVLAFDLVRVDEWKDCVGIMKLTLPPGQASAGEAVTLRVTPAANPPLVQAHYMVFEDPRTTAYYGGGLAIERVAGATVVGGFARMRGDAMAIAYNSYRSETDLGAILYMNKTDAVGGRSRVPPPGLPRSLRWETQPVPADASGAVMFVWSCAMTGASNDAIRGLGPHTLDCELSLGEGGRPLATFRCGVASSEVWREGDVSLHFDWLRADEWGDVCGFMRLVLPPRMVTPGEPAVLTIEPVRESPARAFYILYRDPGVAVLFE